MFRVPKKLARVFALLSIVGGAGCRPAATQFEVLSFRSNSPEIYRERFDHGSYCLNADHSWTFAFEIQPVQVLMAGDAADPSTSQPVETTTPDDDLWMSQTLLVEVFWRPLPGTSFAESSQTNANIVYGLTTGAGSITYEGAGFVSFAPSMDKKRMEGRIESATLYPARTVKEPSDLFGPCRLTGAFTAMEDRKRVVEKKLEMRRRLGPPITRN